MTPKEKAEHLVYLHGIARAILVVEEILIAMPTYPRGGFLEWHDCREIADKYWESVKTEIENL